MVWLLRLRALRSLLNSFRLGWRLLCDPRMPKLPKILFGIALLLIVSPINWIPSSIPVLGQLEDLALLAFAVSRFVSAAPARLRAEHEARLNRTSSAQASAY
jgi:uncharacterized membrane protein YkvA (DUF1232 family)